MVRLRIEIGNRVRREVPRYARTRPRRAAQTLVWRDSGPARSPFSTCSIGLGSRADFGRYNGGIGSTARFLPRSRHYRDVFRSPLRVHISSMGVTTNGKYSNTFRYETASAEVIARALTIDRDRPREADRTGPFVTTSDLAVERRRSVRSRRPERSDALEAPESCPRRQETGRRSCSYALSDSACQERRGLRAALVWSM